MTWSDKQKQAASAENWQLCEVVDAGSRHVYYRAFSLAGRDSDACTAMIVARARTGSQLHVEALRLIVASHGTKKTR